MIIYRVTEYSVEEFFEKKEDARKFMEDRVKQHLKDRDDVFVNVDLPDYIGLRFGNPKGDSGLYTSLKLDEIVVR